MIKVTEMKVGNYPVQIPVGLSELLEGCWVKEKKEVTVFNEYERVVECRDGQLFTKLIKKKAS